MTCRMPCARSFYNREIYDIPVATMITQVRVDADDPAFEAPSKPIGHFMTEDQAKLAEEKYGYIMKEDARKRLPPCRCLSKAC